MTIGNIKNLKLAARQEESKANLDYEIEILRYGSKAGKRIFIPLNPFYLN